MSNTVPSGWLECSLPDVCYFQEGPGLRNWQYASSGYPFINIRCIKEGYLDLSNVQYISWDEANQKYQHFFLNEGDYVLSASGTLGRMAKIRKKDLPLMLNTSVIRFRSINDQALYHDFLPHYLQSQVFVNQITEESQGSAQVNFGPTHLKLVECTLPPLPEQQKIATILSSVDDVIEKTRAQIDKLKDLKTGMMQELLTKGIGSDGVPHTEFKDSPVGRIPAAWDVRLLRDVCERVCVGFVGTCERHYRTSGVPMIRTGNLKDGKLDLTDVRHVTDDFHKKEKKSQLRVGDLLIARHGSHGSACLVPENLGEANCLNVVIVRPSQALAMPLFLKYVFNSGAMKASFGAKSEGSTQSVISTTEIAKTAFPIPPIAEQQQISAALLAIDERIEFVEKKLGNSLSLKKALMQDLLTGKIRVNIEQKEKESVVA